MQNKSQYVILAVVSLLFLGGPLLSQTTNSLGTFTPYSLFGVGDIVRAGSPVNIAMGGIGQSLRDHRYINFVNPASSTARDPLSFMLDFGVESNNLYHTSSSAKSAYNTFNMSHIVFSFPLLENAAMMGGFMPYSHVGYKFEEKEQDPVFVGEVGDVAYLRYGEGSVNQLFLGAAYAINKNFSVGVQGIYYFGTINRNSDVRFNSSSLHNSIRTNYHTVMESFTGKFGLQYEGKASGRSVVSAGASLMLSSNLKGSLTQLAATSLEGVGIDTVVLSVRSGTHLSIPTELAVGVSFSRKYFSESNLNKWMIGFDYTRQDWSNANFALTPGVDFSPTVKNSYMLGFELTPDILNYNSAYKRWTYRGGIYYEQSYVRLNGQQVSSAGLTLGVALPVFRWSNAVNFTVDMGQRGSVSNQLIRERYVIFQASFSLYDIWFRKMKYE
ncbi:MAG: hypothetical protein FWD56_02185 [Bacteroidales bacterium]|nr:hypothetical protein [Bacteroidales bacterium]